MVHKVCKCGARLILIWVGGGKDCGEGIPWYACPICDKEELNVNKVRSDGIHNKL